MAAARRISTLLVANRGEIARRIISTAHAMGISTLAVYSDADAGAPYVGEADQAVRLSGDRPADTYLSSARVVEAALRCGADAVHPGYGFLSENAGLAEACDAAGLVFVGPPASVVHAMSSKIEAKELASSVGVPVLPMVKVATVAGALPTAGPGVPAREILAARGLRFPLLVKASAGGGGTGIHLVRRYEDLHDALRTARREAESAFGDGTLFLEPFLEAPRHLEVQVLADEHGTVLHLFERECSVQRRHQKVIEEAPSPSISAPLRASMCAAALDLAEAVGYVGAGTVEFLVEDELFYFLEMNTRLQVEHRVTELVTGTDIVRAQLLVASGAPLEWSQAELSARGVAIEARLYAEDPAAGYLPTTGTVEHYAHGTAPGVLFDDGIATGSAVSAHYDGLLAKVVACGDDRDEAIARLGRAVRGLQLDGVRTNRSLLAAVLEDAEFASGRVDTAYLERRDDLARTTLPRAVGDAHALAAAGFRALRSHARSPLSQLPASWRNVGVPSYTVTLRTGAGNLDVSIEGAPTSAQATIGGRSYAASVALGAQPTGPGAVAELDGAAVDVTLDGVRTRCAVRVRGDRVSVNTPAGQSDFIYGADAGVLSDDAGEGAVTTPVPGNVTAVVVQPGDSVREGDVLVIVEAMKMEHRVCAPADGTVVALTVTAGDGVDAHQVLALVDASTTRDGADGTPGTPGTPGTAGTRGSAHTDRRR